VQLAIYAHPFDLDALRPIGGLARLRDLGFTEVAMATSYHDGRWLQPWHPAGRVRFLEDGTVHFRPRADYGVLRPQPSSEVPASGPSPLERLCSDAPPLGIAVRAWNVFTHNTRLGTLHPELCVQNAFGDRYSYALCPSQPAVQQYIVTMAKDLAAHAGLGSIEFEALGWMGWKHTSHHDKASFTPRGLLDYALSLCFCDGCVAQVRAEIDTESEGDPDRPRQWARQTIRTFLEDGDAMAPITAPERLDAAKYEAGDPETVEASDAVWPMTAARVSILSRLGRAVRDVLPKNLVCAVQSHPNDLFSGSQVPVRQTAGLLSARTRGTADEHVFTAYGEDVPAIDKLLRGETMHHVDKPPYRRRVSIWPKAPQFKSDEDLVKLRDLLGRENVGAVAIYHLGLLPWRTIERVAKILRA